MMENDNEEESSEDEEESENKEDSQGEEGSDDEEESVNEKGSSEQEEGSEHEDRLENKEGSPEEEVQDGEGSEYEEGSTNGQGSENREGSEHHWNPPDCLPICCMTHLKNVVLRGFTGEEGEMEVAKYLLKCGEVLDKMSISLYDDYDSDGKEKIYKELLKAPRGSRTSIVEFNQNAFYCLGMILSKVLF